MRKTKKKYLFILLIALFDLLLISFSLFYKSLFNASGGEIFSCKFHALFGLYCMGCGGSRAVVALLEFKFIRSFLFYPAVITSAALILICEISIILNLMGKTKKLFFNYKIFLLIPALIVLNFLIKNLSLLLGYDLNLLIDKINF